jgi:DNA-binding transcriptional LysR family regulator
MNNLQIEYFLAVVQNVSFSKAAAELYVSQPAISRQIAALEKELGYALFDRAKQPTRLTKQ